MSICFMNIMSVRKHHLLSPFTVFFRPYVVTVLLTIVDANNGIVHANLTNVCDIILDSFALVCFLDSCVDGGRFRPCLGSAVHVE